MSHGITNGTDALRLYSAWYCPFAQRAWMSLLLKGVDFEYIEVDPYRKSDWWLRVSRNSAKVPVIVNRSGTGSGETTIIDSTRTIEYLDDLVPGTNPLLPCEPNERAEIRYWIDHVNKAIVPYFYRYLQTVGEGEHRQTSRAKLLAGLQQLSAAMSSEGVFFSGGRIGIIDILLIPFAYRIETLLGHYRGFAVPEQGVVWERYGTWYRAMLDEPVFKLTATDHQGYRQRLIDFYLPYSQGEGQKDVAQVS